MNHGPSTLHDIAIHPFAIPILLLSIGNGKISGNSMLATKGKKKHYEILPHYPIEADEHSIVEE